MAFLDNNKAFDMVETYAIINYKQICRADSRYAQLIENIYKAATNTMELH